MMIAMRLVSMLLVGVGLAGAAAEAAGRVVEVNGTSLYVVDEGQGDPIVLVHGGFMDSDSWDLAAAALRTQYRVIRFDLRGFGRSLKPVAPYAPTDDIRALLDKLDVPRAHVVGISMGGAVAINFAIAHPSRVRSLALVEPGLGGYPMSSDVTDTMRAVAATARDRGREAAIEEFLRRPVFASATDKPDAYAMIRSQLAKNFSLESPGMRDISPAAATRLGELTTPTLMMVGEFGGPDAKAIGRKIAAESPRAELVQIGGAGHMINLEQPAAFERQLRTFLARH